MTDEPPPQTALLLTQQEWDDLAAMLKTWLARWSSMSPPTSDLYKQRVALAERIIEANQ